jgi:hypothetical protein
MQTHGWFRIVTSSPLGPKASIGESGCRRSTEHPLRGSAGGIGGAVQLVILGGELGFFVEHELVDGVNAVLQGVEAGCRLTRRGAAALEVKLAGQHHNPSGDG